MKSAIMKLSIPFMSLLAVILVISTASQCHDDALSTSDAMTSCNSGKIPTWVDSIISDAEQNGHKGEVLQYRYKGKRVFLINTCAECDDSMSEVYDCQQNVICRFGGIAGFNTCPDFSQKASNETIIWRN